jgi:hypothetical protein
VPLLTWDNPIRAPAIPMIVWSALSWRSSFEQASGRSRSLLPHDAAYRTHGRERASPRAAVAGSAGEVRNGYVPFSAADFESAWRAMRAIARNSTTTR